MKTIHMVRFKWYGLLAGFLFLLSACNRNTYPCPDIHGGTEVVKAGSAGDLKKTNPDMDDNGRLVKKPYSHPGMKKRKR